MVKVLDSDPGVQEGELNEGGDEGEGVLVVVEVDSGGVLGAVSVEEHLECCSRKSVRAVHTELASCGWDCSAEKRKRDDFFFGGIFLSLNLLF